MGISKKQRRVWLTPSLKHAGDNNGVSVKPVFNFELYNRLSLLIVTPHYSAPYPHCIASAFFSSYPPTLRADHTLSVPCITQLPLVDPPYPHTCRPIIPLPSFLDASPFSLFHEIPNLSPPPCPITSIPSFTHLPTR